MVLTSDKLKATLLRMREALTEPKENIMAVAAETAKRGKGPVSVTFVDDKGKADFRRVPELVSAIRVTDAKGAFKDFPVNKINPSMAARFAAYGVASRVKMFVTHNIEDGPALDLASQLMTDFAEAKMYARAEGTGERKGKVFDPTIYIEALKLAQTEMFEKQVKYPKGTMKDGKDVGGQLVASKVPTQKQLDDKKTALVALPGTDRTKALAKMNKNPYYAKHFLALKSKNIDTSEAEALF